MGHIIGTISISIGASNCPPATFLAQSSMTAWFDLDRTEMRPLILTLLHESGSSLTARCISATFILAWADAISTGLLDGFGWSVGGDDNVTRKTAASHQEWTCQWSIDHAVGQYVDEVAAEGGLGDDLVPLFEVAVGAVVAVKALGLLLVEFSDLVFAD